MTNKVVNLKLTFKKKFCSTLLFRARLISMQKTEANANTSNKYIFNQKTIKEIVFIEKLVNK